MPQYSGVPGARGPRFIEPPEPPVPTPLSPGTGWGTRVSSATTTITTAATTDAARHVMLVCAVGRHSLIATPRKHNAPSARPRVPCSESRRPAFHRSPEFAQLACPTAFIRNRLRRSRRKTTSRARAGADAAAFVSTAM